MLVHKTLDFELSEHVEEERSFWAVASTGEVDRQGDSIDPNGWDFSNFLKNPVIPWAHDYDAPPVAKALELKVEGDKLMCKVQFPTEEEYPFADTIYKLYRGGFLSAFSVGFTPLASSKARFDIDGRKVLGTRYLKQELYEISCVTLPANPAALADNGSKQICLPEAGLKAANPNLGGPKARISALAAAHMLDALTRDRLNSRFGF